MNDFYPANFEWHLPRVRAHAGAQSSHINKQSESLYSAARHHNTDQQSLR